MLQKGFLVVKLVERTFLIKLNFKTPINFNKTKILKDKTPETKSKVSKRVGVSYPIVYNFG